MSVAIANFRSAPTRVEQRLHGRARVHSAALFSFAVFMQNLSRYVLALVAAAATSLSAQQGRSTHRANGGHIPPPPPARPRGAKPEVQTFPGGQVDARPHVDGNRWYGHNDADDRRFTLQHPYANGRFAKIGPTFQYSVARFDGASHRFWLNGGFGFEIAAWDWPFAAGWCWTCPDDIVVYDDPDHPGWYLIYNTETGVYVHAQYVGS